METFITSDTHFGHANIIKYCNRPFASVEEMDEQMIELWNKTVAKDDIVWHLGDFCLGRAPKVAEPKTAKYLKRLNGRINLVLGNHDTLSQRKYLSLGFNKVYDKPIIISERFILSHEPLPLPLPNVSTHFINIYGHVHDNKDYSTLTPNRACVCCERWGYRPYRMSEITEVFTKSKGFKFK